MPMLLMGLNKYPDEARIIGRLLAGYSELEFLISMCLTAVLDADIHTAVRVMFRTRGEEQRLEIADALMRHKFDAAHLTGPYCEAIKDAGWCRRIRNQFAHCHFDGQNDDGLRIVRLEDSAKLPAGDTSVTRILVSLELLQSQEDYFAYVLDCLAYLHREYQKRVGQIASHAYALPKKIARPPLNSAAG